MNYKLKKFINRIFYNKKLIIKKRSGFTLIELMAVMAIIAILASMILPNFIGYIKEAKKTKIIDECRKVEMAVECYNNKYNKELNDDLKISDIESSNKGVSQYLEGVNLDNLDLNNTSLKNCRDILNGAEFDFKKDTEKLEPSSIKLVK